MSMRSMSKLNAMSLRQILRYRAVSLTTSVKLMGALDLTLEALTLREQSN